jgi:RHS repeat-associated protein
MQNSENHWNRESFSSRIKLPMSVSDPQLRIAQHAINTTGSTPNVCLYRGEQFDPDLGLYYLRARYINPTTGPFLSRDTYSGITTDPASLHKYLYANGSPINFADPTGMFSEAAVLRLPSLGWGASLATVTEVGGTYLATGAVAVAALEIDCLWELAGSWIELALEGALGIDLNGALSAGPASRWMRQVCSGKKDRNERCGTWHEHHMIPQEFGPIVDPILKGIGIVMCINDDDFIMCCQQDAHLGELHGGGWNNLWRVCLGAAPSPSTIFGCLLEITKKFSAILGDLNKCIPLKNSKLRPQAQ